MTRIASAVLAAVFWVTTMLAHAGVCGSAVEVPLKSERTGHLSTAIEIDGHLVRMLVDTGANVSTLDQDWAAQHGVAVVGSADLPQGEGRAELPVRVVRQSLGTQSFSVMDLHFINLPSKRYGTEPFAGQLGAAFFSQFKAQLLFGPKVMCLEAPARGGTQ